MSNRPPTPSNSSANRDESLEAVLADFIRACESGREPDREQLLARHAELSTELREFFRQHDQINKLAEPIRNLADAVLWTVGPGRHISYLGNYELLEEIARGGMGIVFKARQTTLDRIVAVKMILSGNLAGESDIRRFQAEARAAANLKHPNIVSIHEVGEYQGWHYFSMDYVPGYDLATIVREHVLSPKQAATFVRQMAEAIHFAHQQGVLHRDLKPSNVLVDRHDQVHITDFGLAMRVEGNSAFTRTGEVLGTPSYMPPEQAECKRSLIGPGSDVYSLGAVLYECLTGRPPFRAESAIETIQQVVSQEPASPRLVNSNTPRDLETICLTCLQKEPHRRYANAQLLADDLGRFLRNEPIVARPVTPIARALRWCQRNPMIAAMSAAMVLLLSGIATITSVGYVRESKLREAEQTARKRFEVSDQELRNEQKRRAELQLGVTELEQRQQELSAELSLGQKKLDEGSEKLSETYLQLARAAWNANELELADYYLNLCPPSFRSSAWQELKLKCYPNLLSFPGKRCVSISRDGSMLAAAGDDAQVNVWRMENQQLRFSLEGHKAPVRFVRFSPDGKLLLSADSHKAILWEVASGRALGEWVEKASQMWVEKVSQITDMEFHPAGKFVFLNYLVTETKSVIIGADTTTLQKLFSWEGGRRFAVVSTDGRWLVTYGRTTSALAHLGAIKLFASDSIDHPAPSTAPAAEETLSWLHGNALSFTCRPVFHPQRNELALPNGKRIEFWDVEKKEKIHQISLGATPDCLAYSPDGKRLAIAMTLTNGSGDPIRIRVEVWNLVVQTRERVLPWYSNPVTQMVFTSDGRGLATADAENIKLWDIPLQIDPTDEILTNIAELDVGRHDWPQWGGSPARINTPAGKNIPVNWSVGDVRSDASKSSANLAPGSKNIKWSARLGFHTYGNPVVANGKLFLGTNNGAGYVKRYPTEMDLGVLLCFDEQSGKFLWQHSNGKLPTGRAHDWPYMGVCSTPTVDGNRLWYVNNRGEVVCLDTEGFHDGEDDGPDQGIKLPPFQMRASWDQYLNTGASTSIPDEFRKELRSRLAQMSITLPDQFDIHTNEPDKSWSLDLENAGQPLEIRIHRLWGSSLNFELRLALFDEAEADVVWKFDMMSELGVSQHNMANCSVLTVGDTLFVCTSNGVDDSHVNIPAPEAPSFIALDRRTGKLLWTDNSPGKNILHAQWASPSYAVLEGQPQVLFPGGDGWVYSFDPQGDGKGGAKLLWKFDGNPKTSFFTLGGRGTRNDPIAFAAIYDGHVYLVMGQDPEHGEGQGNLWCIKPGKRSDGADVSAELAVDATGNIIPHRRIQAVDHSKGERAIPNPNSAVVWEYSQKDRNGDGKIEFEEKFHRSMSTPVIKDNVLYVADITGLFHCMNAKSGQVYFTYDMLATCWGSPLLVDNKVYIADEDGDVAIFRHTTHPGYDMQAVESPNGQTVYVPQGLTGSGQAAGSGIALGALLSEMNMGNEVYMTPIVANNVLYIATKDMLYAIQEMPDNRSSRE